MMYRLITLVLAIFVSSCGGGGGGDSPEPSPSAPSSKYIYPTFTVTAKMRDQAALEADWGSVDAQMNGKVFTNDPDEIARMFRNDEGAVMCQGVAYYLHLRYLQAGFRSYLVGFQSEVGSHAVTLVEIARDDGSKALIVQDPTFNLSYFGPDGQPLSIFDLMTALAQKRHQDVIPREGLPVEVEYLQRADDPAARDDVVSTVAQPSDNPTYLSYRIKISLAEYQQDYRAGVTAYTAKVNVPDNYLYAMFDEFLYAFKRWPMTEEDARDAKEFEQALFAHIAATGGW